MNIQLLPVKKDDRDLFIKDIQEAFQYGYEVEYGPCEDTILPLADIKESFNAKGAVAYYAESEGEIIGGTIVTIDEKTQHNHLELLYVKVGCQSKGVGLAIWKSIERTFPDTIVWETFTPYFEKRNLHFYVNKCGFHVVEFINPMHKAPWSKENEQVGGMCEEAGDYFFRFEKRMKESDSSLNN